MATCCYNGFEATRRRPLFKIVMRRAAINGYKNGTISAEDTNKAFDAIHNSHRKDKNGNDVDIIEETHTKVLEMVQADANLPDDVKIAATSLSFDWGLIWDWIVENWATILKVILTILMMLI